MTTPQYRPGRCIVNASIVSFSMTNESRVFAFLVLFCAAQAGVLTGSDFFCRDPDTGRLHGANTTWESTTFCGNYTCKLRKKNIIASEYAPFRQINVTKINFFSTNNEKQPKNSEINDQKIVNNIQEDKGKSNSYTNTESEDDRYLTEQEIKTISEILHFMKKSDLDAIIEIYKLAQDIYKEIDTSDIENIVAEVGEFKTKQSEHKITSNDVNAFNVKAQSYWNGPAFTNTRSRDMDTQGTNIITSVSQPKKTESYFIGPLISSDFRKLPYYYPVSSFQKISSYARPRPTLNMPCNLKPSSSQKIQKDIRPSLYLPYPFSYIHHYNYNNNSSYVNSDYKRNFDKYDSYTRKKLPYGRPYLDSAPNSVIVNSRLKEDRTVHANTRPEKGPKEILKAILKSNKEEVPDWQTSPLAVDVLEDVRAHVQEKAKILRPFRKNIKLERVGKLIKLEELPRKKREAPIEQESKRDLELYEVFLDKTTCSSNDTVPGYFRYGNLSHPFPECCPQRIGNR